MSRVIIYVIILFMLVLSASVPVLHTEGEKYYVYEFSTQTFENGKPSLNYSITVKLVEVNETAYRVEVLKYSGPEIFERQIEVWLETLENFTGGLMLVRKGFLSTVVAEHFIYTLWIDPGKFEAGKEASAKIIETADKLCSMGGSREDISKRQELVRKLYEENEEGMRVLMAAFWILQSGMLDHDLVAAGLSEETKYICNGGLTISVNELENVYVFKLTVSKTTSTSEWVRTIETRYAKSGWLFSSTYREDAKSKRTDGSQYTRKVVETAKLVDTNDEELKKIMEKEANMGSSIQTGGSDQPIPVLIETTGITVATIVMIVLIVFLLKNYKK